MAAKPIPEGFHTVTPYLIVNDVQNCVDFMTNAFGAVNEGIVNGPDGKAMHATVAIGDSKIMIGSSMQDHPALPTMLYIYSKDAEKLFKQAVQAGGKTLQDFKDQPWGDRGGAVKDPQGNSWWIATHTEDLSGEEIVKRLSNQAQRSQSGNA